MFATWFLASACAKNPFSRRRLVGSIRRSRQHPIERCRFSLPTFNLSWKYPIKESLLLVYACEYSGWVYLVKLTDSLVGQSAPNHEVQ